MMRVSLPARVLTLGTLLAVLSAAPSAQAAWSANGAGSAAGRAFVMPNGNPPTVSATGTDVTLRWSAALFPGGAPVEGYRIARIGANGQPVLAQASCAGTITTTTCTEHNVPTGTWTYTDTPIQGGWSGQTSSPSNSVAVP